MSKFLCVITMCLMMQSSLFCSEFTPTKETWDYAKSMKEVSAKFKGTAGMVMHMGDSITYANQNTRWARSFKWSKKGGYSASDIEILKWSHADKDKNKLNISFVTKKKIGNAVKRNKIKRRLRNIVNDAVKKISLNFNYSYLVIAKPTMLNNEYAIIKETIFQEFKRIR